MKAVIKVGGTLLEDGQVRENVAAWVGAQFHDGHKILLVHGGGKLLTRYLDQIGIKSNFIDGLRVTTEEAMDGVVKVFAGTVNHQLLAQFHKLGVPAVGISGIDAGCLVAEKMTGRHGEDLGFVGKVKEVNPRVWDVLLAGQLLPVMACLAVGEDGQIYNINADQAAAACAVRMRADALIFLTDVDGVRDAAGNVVSRLHVDEITKLVDSGAVTGGMLAKLNSVRDALARPGMQVHICNGRSIEALMNGISRYEREEGIVIQGHDGIDALLSPANESGTTVYA